MAVLWIVNSVGKIVLLEHIHLRMIIIQFKELENMSIETMIIFQQFIKAGKLSDVIDMYNSLNLNSEPVNTYILNYACEVNKLSIIKWILNNSKFDSKTLSDVFLNTISYGHIHISQWLYENYNTHIDIHIYNDLMFKLAQYHNRLEYINWLENIKEDNKVDNKGGYTSTIFRNL